MNFRAKDIGFRMQDAVFMSERGFRGVESGLGIGWCSRGEERRGDKGDERCKVPMPMHPHLPIPIYIIYDDHMLSPHIKRTTDSRAKG